MVDVPVQNGDFSYSIFLLSVAGSYCNIIEDAKSHSAIRCGVVARGSDGAKSSFSIGVGLGINFVDCSAHRPCGVASH